MTVQIPLTKSMCALVDDADAEIVNQCRWYAFPSKHTWYACRRYVQDGRSISQNMHTLITGWSFVDHRNGNGLDNRRENLRAATHTQNLGNRRKVRGKSRFKGVYWIDRSKVRPWVASIQIHGKGRHLGYFASEEEAGRAYDDAAREAFGEFAALNFPRPGERSALDLFRPDVPEIEPAQTCERPPANWAGRLKRLGNGVSEIRWEDPPPQDTARKPEQQLDHHAIAEALRSRPDQWALIAVGKHPSLARHIQRAKGASSYAPAGAYEATYRFIDGVAHTYARYVGGVQ